MLIAIIFPNFRQAKTISRGGSKLISIGSNNYFYLRLQNHTFYKYPAR